MAIAGAVLLSVLTLLMVFIGVSVSGPIRRFAELMDALAKGDFETNVPYRDRRDEIGLITEAVQAFKVRTDRKSAPPGGPRRVIPATQMPRVLHPPEPIPPSSPSRQGLVIHLLSVRSR